MPHKDKDIAFKVGDGFAKRLKQVVAESGMSTRSFAESMGCDRKVIYTWYRGRCLPSADALASMRMNHGVDINWLLTGEPWSS